MSGNMFDSAKRTRLRQGSQEVAITLEDLQAMRQTLLEALAHSHLGDKNQLIALAEPLPAWIDSEGRAMVSGWMLQIRDGRVTATYRLTENEDRALGYAASFAKTRDGWRVDEIVPEKIRFRR